MAPFKSIRTRTCRCAAPSFLGRPGEKRTFRAFSPPRRRALRQRITELGEHSIRRPTSLSDRPSSKSARPLRRLSSSNSADPRGLITNLLEVNHSILYAALFKPPPIRGRDPWSLRATAPRQFPLRPYRDGHSAVRNPAMRADIVRAESLLCARQRPPQSHCAPTAPGVSL